jgi:hypothetical protein
MQKFFAISGDVFISVNDVYSLNNDIHSPECQVNISVSDRHSQDGEAGSSVGLPLGLWLTSVSTSENKPHRL